MLEEYFSDARAIGRHLKGPFGRYVEGFVAWLKKRGYARKTVRRYVPVFGALGRWLHRRKLGAGDVSTELAGRFLHRSRTGGVRPNERAALKQALLYLRQTGVAPQDDSVSEPDPADCLIAEFIGYLIHDRALAEVTVENRCSHVRFFLTACFGTDCVDVDRLSVSGLQDFVLDYARDRAPRSTQSMLTSLRSFLRFLYLRELISVELADHVPSIVCWRQTTPPKWLPDEDVERVLNCCDRHSAVGQRDYAILLLLARLGLRAGEVRMLELDDIRWEAAEISVRGKGARRKRFPLPGDVGEAIAAYLKDARPQCDSRRVFLRAVAPCRGLGSSTVGTIVVAALRRAGLTPSMKGSHLFRHSLATRMLGKGATLTEIGQVLHHANPDTTSIYAKVNIAGLRGLAMPWPGDDS